MGNQGIRGLAGMAGIGVLLAVAHPPRVAGTYETRVTLLSSSCPFEVQSNPTEVAQYGDSVITLRHAGTTYEGVLASDASFETRPKRLEFGTTTYEIGIRGHFAADSLSALVSLRFGQPECRAEVRWEGPRRAGTGRTP